MATAQTLKQQQAWALKEAGHSPTQIAETLKANRATVHKWLAKRKPRPANDGATPAPNATSADEVTALRAHNRVLEDDLRTVSRALAIVARYGR